MALLEDTRANNKTRLEPGQTRRTGPVNIDYATRESEAQNDLYGGRKTVDQEFSEDAYADKMRYATSLSSQQSRGAAPSRAIREQLAAEEAYEVIKKAQTSARIQTQAAQRQALRNKTEQSKASFLNPRVLAARARATGISVAALSWAGTLWLFVQVPFALLGIAGLGGIGLIDSMTGSTGVDPGFFASLARTVLQAINSLLGLAFLEIAGFVFTVSYVMVFAIGMITLFSLYMQYTLGMLRPLSGEGDGFKFGMLLLAIIGYAIPLANLLPWAAVWMIAVWLHPR